MTKQLLSQSLLRKHKMVPTLKIIRIPVFMFFVSTIWLGCQTEKNLAAFNFEKKAINYLKNEIDVRSFFKKASDNKSGDVTFFVSSWNIYPKLNYFSEDSIPNKEELFRVIENFQIGMDESKTGLSDDANSPLKIFFSSLGEEHLYCELFWDDGYNLSVSKDRFRYNGLALAFLFSFNERGEIVNVVKQQINYN